MTNFIFRLAIFSLTAFSVTSHATLTSYTVNGEDFVYSSISDVTWTRDANLLGTMMANQGFSTVVNAIIAASPTVIDTPSPINPTGIYTVNTTDFISTGNATWWGVQAFVNFLNVTHYGGSAAWRIPTVTDIGNDGCNFSYNGTDCGTNVAYNGAEKGDELAELYYAELGSKAQIDINGNAQYGYGFNDLNNLFKNEQLIEQYWLGTEGFEYSESAYNFAASGGYQETDTFPKSQHFNSWLISSGLIAAVVPEPNNYGMWTAGLGLMILIKRKKSLRSDLYLKKKWTIEPLG